MDIFNITLEGLLLGALAIAIGLAFAFWGFRVFLPSVSSASTRGKLK